MRDCRSNKPYRRSTLTILSAFIAVTALIFVSCSDYIYSESGFYAGETVTPQRLAEISQSLAAQQTSVTSEKASAETTAALRFPDTDEDGETIVYFTGSGEVWHYNRDCGSIKNSSNVTSGTIEQAIAAGKSRACGVCSKAYLTEDAEGAAEPVEMGP